MDIEKMATGALKMSISATETMSPYINEDDKEPVWDGNIYIYENKQKRSANIKRVPVQVKGVQCSVLPSEAPTYQVKVSDLQNYLDDGGVFFFVVYITKSGLESRIYYSALLPVKLQAILADCEGKKTKAIKLLDFPTENQAKTTLLLTFYEHHKMQDSFSAAKLHSMEELEESGQLEGITIPFTKYGGMPDVRDFVSQDEFYVYATVKGVEIPVPLEGVAKSLHVSKYVSQSVSVNGKQYYPGYYRIISKGQTELQIGRSMHITIADGSNQAEFKIKPTTILKDALIDLPFLIDVSAYKQIEFGGLVLEVPSIDAVLSEERLDIIRNNLDYSQQAEAVFDALRLNKQYDLQTISKDDNIATHHLYRAIVEGKTVSGLQPNIPAVFGLKYLNTIIPLIFIPEGKPGTYRISDFGSDTSFYVVREYNGETVPTSRFAFMTEDHFLEWTNLDFEMIYESFLPYIKEPYFSEDATRVVLSMLKAYDRSETENAEMLVQVKRIAELLIENAQSEDNLILAKMNYLQAVKRTELLSKDQNSYLLNIAEDASQPTHVRFGAHLLLDNKKSAEHYFNQMEEQQQEEYRTYPIFHFWKADTE